MVVDETTSLQPRPDATATESLAPAVGASHRGSHGASTSRDGGAPEGGAGATNDVQEAQRGAVSDVEEAQRSNDDGGGDACAAGGAAAEGDAPPGDGGGGGNADRDRWRAANYQPIDDDIEAGESARPPDGRARAGSRGGDREDSRRTEAGRRFGDPRGGGRAARSGKRSAAAAAAAPSGAVGVPAPTSPDGGGGGGGGGGGSTERSGRRTRRVRAWGPSPCCIHYKVGALSVVCEWRSGDGRKTRLFVGPYWQWLLATAAIIASLTALVYAGVATDVPWRYRGSGLGLAGLSLILLFATATADPGIFRRHPRPLEPSWTWSEIAQSYRPPGTVYCHESEVLIEGYDHFCPWSGTVIGAKNRGVFLAWIVVLVASLLFEAVLVVRFLIQVKGGADSAAG